MSRLILQFPCAFEFNEQFLITVLDHLTRYEKQSIAESLKFLIIACQRGKVKLLIQTDFFPVSVS